MNLGAPRIGVVGCRPPKLTAYSDLPKDIAFAAFEKDSVMYTSLILPKVKEVLDALYGKLPDFEVVTGGAAGVDTLAETWAKDNGKNCIVYRPDYANSGRAAPLVRNVRIVEMSTRLIAFTAPWSTGTFHTINEAVRARKRVEHHAFERDGHRVLRPTTSPRPAPAASSTGRR